MAGKPIQPSTPKNRKTRPGDTIQLKGNVFIDKTNNYILSEGERFKVEAITPTGAVRVTKTFSTGETKKAMVSKAYYEKVV